MQLEPKKKTSCETQIILSNTFELLLHEKDIALASLDFLNTDDDSSCDSSRSDDVHIKKINTFVYLVSSRTNEWSQEDYLI